MTAAWFTRWINLQEKVQKCGQSQNQTPRRLCRGGGSDLSASSSVTSLLRGGTGLPCWADTGDRLFEVEETEEKFFCDLVREPFSNDTSSLAVAFRMLLKDTNS